MVLGLMGSAEAVRRRNRKREKKKGGPSSWLCKPGRCKWLYYSWECNSYNQWTAEPMKSLFIISENDITESDSVLSRFHWGVACGPGRGVDSSLLKNHVCLNAGKYKTASKLIFFVYPWINNTCLGLSLWLTWLCIAMQKGTRGEEIPPTFTSLWDWHPEPKTIFLLPVMQG